MLSYRINIKKEVIEILKREKIIQIAFNFYGYEYISGGNSFWTGFDCSGFTQYVYSLAGIKIPRSVKAQYVFFKKIKRKTLKKGDLVFFVGIDGTPSHVGIYIGKDKFIHAPSPGKRVKVDSLNRKYFKYRFICGGTIF